LPPPQFSPASPTLRPAAFDHDDFIFELKMDGFRALACPHHLPHHSPHGQQLRLGIPSHHAVSVQLSRAGLAFFAGVRLGFGCGASAAVAFFCDSVSVFIVFLLTGLRS